MSGFTVAAGVVAAGALTYSAVEQSRARSDQRRANERSRRIESVQAQRQRTDAIRQNRTSAAQVFAQAAASGQQQASATQSTLGALGTNQAINQQFTGAINTLNMQRMRFLDRAQGHQSSAAIGQQVAQVAGTVGSV